MNLSMSGREQIGQAPGAAAIGSLGSYLVGQGLVKQAQLEEAKQSRSVYGGRLGTNLVELGYLGLEELATHLAAYHGLSMPPIDWLEAPDPKALKLVPMPLVRKLKILPLHLEREAIHVAMVDPRDPEQLEFVTTAANRPVVSYVLPEIRLLYWLEMHLQIDRHPRYVNLAARLRRTDMRVPDDGTPCAAPAEAEESPPPPAGAAQTPPVTSERNEAQAPELLEQWFNETESNSSEPRFAFGDASPARPMRRRETPCR